MNISMTEQIRFISEILTKAGITYSDSQLVAKSLTLANLRGVDSHGILRLPVYAKRIKLGLMDKQDKIKVIKEDNVSAIIDGSNYIGQIVGRKATEKAIEKASQNTISMVLAKNSNHFGEAAEYSMMIAENNMIGIVASNTTPLMPPTGGIGKILGTNPLSISFPAGEYNIVTLDMALSSVAMGKVLYADSNNMNIPNGWGIDKDGNNTTNPKDVLNGGYLLPAAGPKGYGLALAIEVLTAVLTNSSVSKEVKSIYQYDEKNEISQAFIAINIDSFIDKVNYNERVETLVKYIKECPTAYGVSKIYLPGEIELETYNKRLLNGININDELSKQLEQLAKKLEVEPLNPIN